MIDIKYRTHHKSGNTFYLQFVKEQSTGDWHRTQGAMTISEFEDHIAEQGWIRNKDYFIEEPSYYGGYIRKE